MSYSPPELPIEVSWEGADAYAAPSLPIDAEWGEAEVVFIGAAFSAQVSATVPPITAEGQIASFLPEIKGTITGDNGLPAQRRIRVFHRSSNQFIGEAESDAATGHYQIQVPGYGEYHRIALAEDESEPLLNDLIDRVKVEWPE